MIKRFRFVITHLIFINCWENRRIAGYYYAASQQAASLFQLISFSHWLIGQLALPDKHFKPFQLSLERRVFNGRIKPGWCFHHRLGMGKGIEAMPAVVSPDSTVANTAKRKMMICKMPNRIVHATSAKCNTFNPCPFLF